MLEESSLPAQKQIQPLPSSSPQKGAWVQTPRAAHEAFAALIRDKPKAAMLMHLLVARLGNHNAVVVSQSTLSELMRCHVNTVKRSISDLVAGNWIEVRQIGERGTVNAYIVNDRVAWLGPREGLRHSIFSATVIVSASEQPDKADLGQQFPLRPIPSLFAGERQLPSGDGLPPPVEPSLPGMEPDLPAMVEPDDRAPMEEARSVGSIAESLLGRLG